MSRMERASASYCWRGPSPAGSVTLSNTRCRSKSASSVPLNRIGPPYCSRGLAKSGACSGACLPWASAIFCFPVMISFSSLRPPGQRPVVHGNASNVVGLRRTGRFGRRTASPRPAADFRHVVTIAGNILAVLDQPVADRLLGIGGPRAQPRQPVDHGAHQVETVELVQHAHVERRRGRALLLVAAHVDIAVPVPTIGQAMDEPGIAVKGEDDRLVGGEEGIEKPVPEPRRGVGGGGR